MNYYETLGVGPNSSNEEISTAYKKLMKKVHPDINNNDIFFVEFSKRLNEAYNILSDETKRKVYDKTLNPNQEQSRSSYTESNSNKSSYENQSKNETHIKKEYLKFKTSFIDSLLQINYTISTSDPNQINLDKVSEILNSLFTEDIANVLALDPDEEFVSKSFGLLLDILRMMPIGFENKFRGRLLLLASVSNSSANTLRDFEKGRANIKNLTKFKIYSLIGIISFVILLIVIKENFKTEQVSSKNMTYNGAEDKNVVSEDNAILDLEPSEWKGNRLINGASPYDKLFGKGVYDYNSPSNLDVVSTNSYDVVLILTDISSGLKIRNEYIRANSNFRLSNIPLGSYTIEYSSGTDWNPNLNFGNDLVVGGFENKSSFTRAESVFEYKSRGDSWKIILQPVQNGNLSKSEIDAQSFFH